MRRGRPALLPQNASVAGPGSEPRTIAVPTSGPFDGGARASPRAPVTGPFLHHALRRLPERSTTCLTSSSRRWSSRSLTPSHAPHGRCGRPGAAGPRSAFDSTWLDLTLKEEGDHQGIQRQRLHEGQTDDEGGLDLVGRIRIAPDRFHGRRRRPALPERGAERRDAQTESGSQGYQPLLGTGHPVLRECRTRQQDAENRYNETSHTLHASPFCIAGFCLSSYPLHLSKPAMKAIVSDCVPRGRDRG